MNGETLTAAMQEPIYVGLWWLIGMIFGGLIMFVWSRTRIPRGRPTIPRRDGLSSAQVDDAMRRLRAQGSDCYDAVLQILDENLLSAMEDASAANLDGASREYLAGGVSALSSLREDITGRAEAGQKAAEA
jgi:hypothetical protein